LIGLPLDFGLWPLAVALVVSGLVALLWRRPLKGLLLVLIIGAVFFAAMVHEYPLQGRLVLFLVPIAAVAVAAPLVLPARPVIHVVVCALIGITLIPMLASAAHATVDPYTKTEAREAYVYVQQHAGPHDRVFIEWSGIAVYLYYHEILGVTGTGSFQFSGSPKPCDNASQFGTLDRYKRIWFVFAVPPGIEPDAISQYLLALRHAGRVMSVDETPGNAGVVELDVRSSGSNTVQLPAPDWQPAPYGCLQVSLFTPNSSNLG
jgi:hypothetical protein